MSEQTIHTRFAVIESEHKHFATKADVMEAVSEVKISIERLENKLWKYLLVVAIPSIISTAIGIALLIFNILNLLPAQ